MSVYPLAWTHATFTGGKIRFKDFSAFLLRFPLNITKSGSLVLYVAIETATVKLVDVPPLIFTATGFFPVGYTVRVVLQFEYKAVSSMLTRYFSSPIRFRNIVIMYWLYDFLTDCIAYDLIDTSVWASWQISTLQKILHRINYFILIPILEIWIWRYSFADNSYCENCHFWKPLFYYPI